MVYLELEDAIYNKIMKIVKRKDFNIYKEIEEIKERLKDEPLSSIQKARYVKTERVKNKIKETIKELKKQNINPTKYQINKKTNISYVTLHKYQNIINKEIINS